MGTNLYVGNLSYDMTEAQLRELFSQAGTVKSVTILFDRGTNVSRGFGFVEMGTADEATKAIGLLNGRKVAGYTLKVSEARPRERDTSGGFDRGRGDRASPRKPDSGFDLPGGSMNTRLHVGNLSYNTTEARLHELFSQAGRVKSVTRSMDRATNLMRSFAFIEMETASEALNAMKLLDGHDVDGHTIKVSEARPRAGNSGAGFDRGRSHRGRPS